MSTFVLIMAILFDETPLSKSNSKKGNHHMKEFLLRRRLRLAIAAGLVGSAMVAIGVTPIAVQSASASSGSVLTMESSPENTITQSFNPYSTTSAAYQMGATSFIYEPLLQFDAAKAGVIYPWLATSYRWSNGGRSITFAIRKGVRWSNGTLMTPADVAFSYRLVESNPPINTGGLTIRSVSTQGDYVTLTFPSAQYTNLQNIASVYIVPQSIWHSISRPATYLDPNPVGTGPYKLGTFTPQGFSLVKNASYWQASKVRIGTLEFPTYASNTNAEEALFSGAAQWEGNFIPNLKTLFLSKSKNNMAWEAPLNTVSLMPNLSRFPLNQVAVRQAVSLAIDRNALSTQGEAGLEPPALNNSGLTLPVFGAYLTASVKKAYALNDNANVGAAVKVLEKAGWKKGSNGYFEKGGRTLAFSISDPSSYTDYAADGSIIAADLRKAGMDVTFDGLSVTGWGDAVASGNFDSILHWSNTASNPYGMYNGWLNSALDTSSASGDYERLHNAAVNADLAKMASASTLAAESKAMLPIEKFVGTYLPVIPLLYGVAWSEINSSTITGWPTPANPYESGQPATPTNEVVVLHLAPRG
ncbi:MAG: ABC transporter substrate-binding protein [Acidimicrobiales bacterium]